MGRVVAVVVGDGTGGGGVGYTMYEDGAVVGAVVATEYGGGGVCGTIVTVGAVVGAVLGAVVGIACATPTEGIVRERVAAIATAANPDKSRRSFKRLSF